jgi:hypothetical protein
MDYHQEGVKKGGFRFGGVVAMYVPFLDFN